VYDACYAVVAEIEEAVLVTADRLLAAAVERSELIA
jgi:predicted nucleic acid-binding protein